MVRESVTALLDLADEHLECTAFVIALEKNTPGLGEFTCFECHKPYTD